MSNTKVIRAKVLGYCMGVRRATDTAIQAVKDYSANRAFGCNVTDAKKVATLGPLIHNRIALEQLKKRGLGQIETENVDEINAKDNPVIILRAHGEPPATKRILGEKGCTLIDATCPRVLSSQKRAGSYALKGYTVIIAGDNNHAEVIGISGYAQEHGQACYVVENSKDAQQLLHEHFSSEARQKHLVVLIAQTTFSPEEYEAISRVFKKTLNN
ncbi:MAG TPA: 4-hydroxy-3-methylbut-2-enyl diphosphate reductase, partial [Treponemataceae bacterium]|nr:4-hydroxy-3-methylbut-2-enyl diphosphate reductase [Treponemataceae bacterium]